MKNIFLLLLVTFTSLFAAAQNVGIGVNNPEFKLDVAERIRIRSGGSSATSAGLWLNNNANNASPAFIGMQTDNLVGFYGSNGANWALNMNTTNGNVGIGNNNPNAPLQFSNFTSNRKIVLFEGANNDHQFYGFGVNGSTLRYQTPGIADDHVFYSGMNTTSSAELLRIKGNGNTGIGVVDPVYKLDVGQRIRIRSGGDANSSAGIFLNNNANNALAAFIGMQTDNLVGFFGSGAGWGLNMNTQTGNVGIGNADPAFRLDINGRMRIRASGATSGIWFNNSLNTQLRGFIGMENEDAFGLYGDAGAGWALRVSTSSGNIEATKNVNIEGFTKLGNTAPPIKTKVIDASTWPFGPSSITFAHGLDKNKIISYQAWALTADGVLVPSGYWFGVGLSFQVQIDDDNVRIILPANPIDYGLVANRPVKVYITYTE
jgi:hypothetical protein